ncbi:MAG: hypothetical protein PHP23_12260 [Desulfobacterales bacterium]|nr:hypothetical protein [Desulfobacterales bacterium]MDD4071939.1 hypothetical protein [Desulfobacterales bacterium]MDD4393761.1 hypothetical protein [Desulfobacterales bacterium]
MGIFDIWKLSKKDSGEGNSAGDRSGGKSYAGINPVDSSMSSADIQQYIETELSKFKKAADLKDHRYRAGVINFVDVVQDDLTSVNENNYRAVVNMTIATLKNFIEVEKEINRNLFEQIKAGKS